MLDAFSNQENVWQYCVYFLQHSTSQYTLMYALHIMEVSLRVFFNVINCSLSLSRSSTRLLLFTGGHYFHLLTNLNYDNF